MITMNFLQRMPDQLDIMVTGACNAQCAFCVQEATFRSDITRDDAFLAAARKSIREFYEAGGRRVVITGGEPTLQMPRVLSVLAELGRCPDWEVNALYTNGSLLLSRRGHGGCTVAEELLAAGLGCVNLSVHHYLDEINDRILALWRAKPRTCEIAAHLKACGIAFRLNLTVQRAGIASVTDLLEYLDWGFSLGAKDIYVRALFLFAFEADLINDDRNPVKYSASNRVRVDDWPVEIVARSRYMIAGSRCELDRDKTELEFEDPATGKRFYLSKLAVGKENPEGFPYLVLMPDGRLYRGWLGQNDLVEIQPLVALKR